MWQMVAPSHCCMKPGLCVVVPLCYPSAGVCSLVWQCGKRAGTTREVQPATRHVWLAGGSSLQLWERMARGNAGDRKEQKGQDPWRDRGGRGKAGGFEVWIEGWMEARGVCATWAPHRRANMCGVGPRRMRQGSTQGAPHLKLFAVKPLGCRHAVVHRQGSGSSSPKMFIC